MFKSEIKYMNSIMISQLEMGRNMKIFKIIVIIFLIILNITSVAGTEMQTCGE